MGWKIKKLRRSSNRDGRKDLEHLRRIGRGLDEVDSIEPMHTSIITFNLRYTTGHTCHKLLIHNIETDKKQDIWKDI